MIDLSYSRCAGLRGPFRSGLLFLFHLAWKSRLRLPFLIAIGFMVLDIRMQLVIDIDLGRAGRQGVPLLGQGNNPPANVIIVDETDSDVSLDVEEDGNSDDSYTTDSYSVHSGSHIDSNDETDSCEEGKPITAENDSCTINEEHEECTSHR